MIHVRGNNHPAARDFAANQLRFQLFALRNVLHLFRDYALPRKMHLRDVALGDALVPLPLLFAAATAASRFSIQLSRNPIKPPQKPWTVFRNKKHCESRSCSLKSNYGTWGWTRQLIGSRDHRSTAPARSQTFCSQYARNGIDSGCLGQANRRTGFQTASIALPSSLPTPAAKT